MFVHRLKGVDFLSIPLLILGVIAFLFGIRDASTVLMWIGPPVAVLGFALSLRIVLRPLTKDNRIDLKDVGG